MKEIICKWDKLNLIKLKSNLILVNIYKESLM
jgi:hypothetical protein